MRHVHAVITIYMITSWFLYHQKYCELMQTTNDKWKWKQLFKMLALSLDTGLESFSPLVNGPINDGQFAVSRDVNQSLLQFSQDVCCALLHGAVVAIETAQLALNLHQAFQTQSICN